MGNTPSHGALEHSVFDEIWSEALLELPYDMSFMQLVMALDRRFRTMGRRVMRVRIMRAIQRFIPSSEHKRFFKMLQRQRSVIAGSMAQSVITPAFFHDFLPEDLNIFVPWYASCRWVTYLRSLNFEVSEGIVPKYASKYALDHFVARNPDEGSVITVTVSRHNSALVPILTSRFTSQMNFLTEEYIYCVYPRTTMHGLAIDRPVARSLSTWETLIYRGIDPAHIAIQSSRGPCYIYCGLEVRHTWSADGIAMTPWGDKEIQHPMAFLQRNSLSFRLSDVCPNWRCSRRKDTQR